MLKAEGIEYKHGGENILSNISLEIPKGKIMGLIGPNGSGKTTLMQTLSGMISFDTGELSVDDYRHRNVIIEKVVYVNNEHHFPERWPAKKVASLYGTVSKTFNRQRFMGMVKNLHIDLEKQLKRFSRGEKERLFLALALSQEADYYFLDEPLTGIDLITREEILSSLLVFAKEDATILISSHYLDIFEKLFEEVIFIKDGHIVNVIDPELMKEKQGLTLTDYYRQLYKGEQ